MYKGLTIVMLYTFDENEVMTPVRIRLHGDMTRAQLYAGIKKFIKDNYGETVSNRWITKRCTILNEHKTVKELKAAGMDYQSFLDKLAIAIQEESDALENESATEVPVSVEGITEEPVSDLPDSN